MAIISAPQQEGSQERLPHILLWVVLSLVLVGVVSLGVWSLVADKALQYPWESWSPAQLPVYGVVPDFALTDQRGRAVRRRSLEGTVWIASFIFTNCPDECPLMTAEMARLQSDLAHLADFRLVSISIDPERDTPAVLSQFAAQLNADPERWLFLTGDKRAIYHLAKEGFRLGIANPADLSPSSPVKGNSARGSGGSGNPPPSRVGWVTRGLQLLPDSLPFLEPAAAFADHGRANNTLHTTRFVLVDRLAQIRGYYESRDHAALERLRQHLQLLFQNG
jgi:cytochrome oxidase Cu insertion factor (SCO1/SenC/PrrC family)